MFDTAVGSMGMIGTILAIIVFGFIFFILLRELFCWYWKINEIRDLLQKILEKLSADTELPVENKIVKQASSNEPVGMKRADFENKK